jgi:head-tail adaptor
MVFRAGDMRDWLTFEDLSTEQDSDGNTDDVWVPAFPTNSRMPAQLSPLSGRELIAAQAVQSLVTCRIRMRFVYNILAVVPDPGSGIEFLTLLCSSGINQGGTA